jgi:voltage-gated potassium channel
VARPNVALLTNRPLLRRIARPVVGFTLVVVGGVAGFSYLGRVGVVEAAFWVLDPSSIELYFQTHPGSGRAAKGYAIVVRSGLVLSMLWVGETAVTAAFGGQIQEELKRVQNERRLATVEDHTVICGFGMFGRTVAEQLAADGQDVVVVEHDADVYARVRDVGYLGVEGDARREERLEEAGVDRARTLIAAIDDSNVNIQIAVLASQLAPQLDVVVRVGDESYESVARRAGADEVVIPEVAGGELVSERCRER